MKIVRIIARLNVGGPARHVVWLTKNLQSEEFRSVLLTGTVPEGEEDMNYFAAENSVAPVYIPEMSRELSAKDIVSLWKVFRRIVREKPDIIHTHTAKAGTIGRVAGFFYRWLAWKRVKLIHTYHGHVFHSYYGKRKTAIFLLIEKSLAKLTDQIVVISAQQRAEINEQFGVGKASQFRIIPLGIDLAPFENAAAKNNILREEIGAAADEILVGFVGRLTEIKNIPLILQAAKIYAEEYNSALPKLKFVIIGDGHLRESLEAEVDKLGIRETVIFLGNRNDADIFYAGLDIIVLTSLNEGTPLSLIEAMANGKTFVSTAVGGVVDLLGATVEEKADFKIYERGIGVASGDSDALFSALIYLAKDEGLRKTLGAKGKEFVRNNYSKERLTGDIINLYRDLN
ncbi:MAG TPA: glycosyltransferase [Pyrinomonadaceae bacterium]|jgi:glycosyltransferase involved in cell wall biosynthesis|nr:glycosyltransferase [Pyrinomonadaceae bacterium]